MSATVTRTTPVTGVKLGDYLRRQIIRIEKEGALSERQLGQIAGTIAKERHKQLVDGGFLAEGFTRFVDGVEGAPETRIKITKTHPGRIVYIGSSLEQATAYALTICKQASDRIPKRASQFPAGTYAASWRVFVDGREVTDNRFPPNASVAIVVNITPYSRRLEQAVGLAQQKAAYMVTETASRATKSRYSGLIIKRQFVSLPGATGAPFPVPYFLKGTGQRKGRRVRRDRRAGAEMLYPAVYLAVKA